MQKSKGDAKKSTVITINLTREEHAMIVKAAKLSRRSMSQFCLFASLGFAERVMDHPDSHDIEFFPKGQLK